MLVTNKEKTVPCLCTKGGMVVIVNAEIAGNKVMMEALMESTNNYPKTTEENSFIVCIDSNWVLHSQL